MDKNEFVPKAELTSYTDTKLVFSDLRLGGIKCAGAILYGDINIERAVISSAGAVKFSHIVSKKKVKFGRIIDCSIKTECEKCNKEGTGCLQCPSNQVKQYKNSKTQNIFIKKL